MLIHQADKKIRIQEKLIKWLQRYLKVRGVRSAIILASGGFITGVLVQQLGIMETVQEKLNPNSILQTLQDTRKYIEALNTPELPTLQIDMKFKHFKKIEAKREEALQRGMLFPSDEDLVPAEIKFQGQTIPVKMRLKGDLYDHLITDKWSYRIQVKGNDQLLGMRRFSIQHPNTRNYLYEWAWLEHLRREGVLALRYKFVNIVFNGVDKGIYAVEEHFSKELLESQQRREGIILSFDENQWHQQRLFLAPRFVRFLRGELDIENSLLRDNNYRDYLIQTSRNNRVSKDPVLSQQKDTAISLLKGFQEGKLTTSEVFDIPSLAKFLALCDFWQAYHTLAKHNIHFYYNPITAKLELIGFDGDIKRKTLNHWPDNIWEGILQSLQVPELAEAYVKELNRISQPEYLEQIQTELNETLEGLYLALYRDSFPDKKQTRLAKLPLKKVLKERQDNIRFSLEEKNLVLAFGSQNRESQDIISDDTLQIEVRNRLALPVEILGFQIGKEFIPADTSWVKSSGQIYNRSDGKSSVVLMGKRGDNSVKNALFRVRLGANNTQILSGDKIPKINVVTRILGLSTRQQIPVHPYTQNVMTEALPSATTIEQALAKYPFLQKGETQDVLVIKKGEWDVQGDLVLPKGVQLQAQSGTTLRFEKNAIFVSRGVLKFVGTAEEPIVLAPKEDYWGGLVVLEAELPSQWEHVIVKNTRGIGTGVNIEGIDRQGWILTGGITFYKSPISLNYCRILGSKAEDGINVILGTFEFKNSEFADFASDAFDGDFVEGLIESSSFHDVAGDAIDVSGSNIQVKDVVLKDVIDKAISAGEGSTIKATDIQAVTLGIGVASKDLSKVQIDSMIIEDAQHAGLAAYEKKPEFGSANISATNIQFKDTPKNILVQTGSWIDLDGKRIKGTELDVKAMYKAGILGN